MAEELSGQELLAQGAAQISADVQAGAYGSGAPTETESEGGNLFSDASGSEFLQTLTSESATNEPAPVTESVPALPDASLGSTPTPTPQFDMGAYIQAQQARDYQRDQEMRQLLQSLTPKAAPVDTDALLMQKLPPEMRTPENLAAYKIINATAEEKMSALEAKFNKQAEQANFQNEIRRANYEAAQLATKLGAQGFDFSIPGGERASEAIRMLGLTFAAAKGGTPNDHGAEIQQMIDVAARARLAGMNKQNLARRNMQAPAGRAPAVSGAPGTAQSQGQKAVPTEAEAVKQGFKSITDWYLKNR